MTLGTEEELLSECLRDSMSRAVRSMEQWIEQEVILPDGPHANLKFRFDYQPVSRLWIRALDSGDWIEHIYSGPSQSGKSFIGTWCRCSITPASYRRVMSSACRSATWPTTSGSKTSTP